MGEVGEEIKRRLVGRKRKGGGRVEEEERKQAEEADDGGEEEEEGSKVALIDKQQRLKAIHSTAVQHKEAEHDKKKNKRKRNKQRKQHNNSATEHNTQQSNSAQLEREADTGEKEQPPYGQVEVAEDMSTVETPTTQLPSITPSPPLPLTAANTTTQQQPPTTVVPTTSKKSRQGQSQQFIPFVRGKVKRKAKRSRQKNIRKDNRPEHLKPNYLTVLPRPNRPTQTQQQSEQQSTGVGKEKSGSAVTRGDENGTAGSAE